jgi:hypothetical protein
MWCGYWKLGDHFYLTTFFFSIEAVVLFSRDSVAKDLWMLSFRSLLTLLCDSTWIVNIVLKFWALSNFSCIELKSVFNSIHPKLRFRTEIEHINTLNYLDVSIHKTQNSIKAAIYKKPTFTDTTIPYTTNPPLLTLSSLTPLTHLYWHYHPLHH